MSYREIVLLKDIEAYGIYDTELNGFIGFKEVKPNYFALKVKSIWKKKNHASSAFHEHAGVYMRDQKRYEVRKL